MTPPTRIPFDNLSAEEQNRVVQDFVTDCAARLTRKELEDVHDVAERIRSLLHSIQPLKLRVGLLALDYLRFDIIRSALESDSSMFFRLDPNEKPQG